MHSAQVGRELCPALLERAVRKRGSWGPPPYLGCGADRSPPEDSLTAPEKELFQHHRFPQRDPFQPSAGIQAAASQPVFGNAFGEGKRSPVKLPTGKAELGKDLCPTPIPLGVKPLVLEKDPLSFPLLPLHGGRGCRGAVPPQPVRKIPQSFLRTGGSLSSSHLGHSMQGKKSLWALGVPPPTPSGSPSPPGIQPLSFSGWSKGESKGAPFGLHWRAGKEALSNRIGFLPKGKGCSLGPPRGIWPPEGPRRTSPEFPPAPPWGRQTNTPSAQAAEGVRLWHAWDPPLAMISDPPGPVLV